jgi:hydroxypyruvate isomerase
MKFAANLSLMYPGQPLFDRLAAARRDGFEAIEIQFPYAQPASELATELRRQDLQLVLINTPLGSNGEFGLAGLPGEEQRFRADFERALDVAEQTGCPAIHVMAGFPPLAAAHTDCIDTLVSNLQWACSAAGPERALMLEALNHHDMPGYLYAVPEQAAAIVRQVNRPNLRLQFDFFHAAREELPLLATVQSLQPLIHHLQIAGVPGRHEPDLRYPQLLESLRWLTAQGYAGWLGFEYIPAADTSEGLAWSALLRP